MNCTRAEELLSDYREGHLHELLRGELEAHLRACDPCARLLAALDDVLGVLHGARDRMAAPEIEPAVHLAERAAAAALSAARNAPRARPWRAAATVRMQTLAAAAALFATAAVLAGRTALDHRWPQRFVSAAATTGVHLIERKDRAVEDLRVLRVIVGATFAGRVDRVSERVDDYRRLLERRRSAAPAAAPPGQDQPPAPDAGAARPSPSPVSSAEPAYWADRGAGGPAHYPNRGPQANVREG